MSSPQFRSRPASITSRTASTGLVANLWLAKTSWTAPQSLTQTPVKFHALRVSSVSSSRLAHDGTPLTSLSAREQRPRPNDWGVTTGKHAGDGVGGAGGRTGAHQGRRPPLLHTALKRRQVGIRQVLPRDHRVKMVPIDAAVRVPGVRAAGAFEGVAEGVLARGAGLSAGLSPVGQRKTFQQMLITGSGEAAHLEIARVFALLHALHEVHGVVAVDERVLAGSLLAAAPAGIAWSTRRWLRVAAA